MIVLLIFFVAAIVTGILTTRIKQQEIIVRKREERTRYLYEFSRSLIQSKTLVQIVDSFTSTIAKHFGGHAIVLLGTNEKDFFAAQASNSRIKEKEAAVAAWTFSQEKPAGWSTQTLSGSKCLCLPMKGQKKILGVLMFYPLSTQSFFSIDEENFLETLLNQASITIENNFDDLTIYSFLSSQK